MPAKRTSPRDARRPKAFYTAEALREMTTVTGGDMSHQPPLVIPLTT